MSKRRIILEIVLGIAGFAGALLLIFFFISITEQEKNDAPKIKLEQEQCQSRCYPNSVNSIRPCQCDLTKVILND